MPGKLKKKVLFVSHSARRNGAPLLLLEIIKEFKKHSRVPFQILVKNDGELRKEFEDLGETFIWNKGIKPGFINRIFQSFYQRYLIYKFRRISLAFLNTISTGDIQKRLLRVHCKFICYVHELEAAIHIATTDENLTIVLKNTDQFIACSQAVKNNLMANHSVNKNIVRAISTPVSEIFREREDYKFFCESFKIENNIPADATIVGIAGSNEWRKGFDLFFPLIIAYRNLYPSGNAYFIWKGFKPQEKSSYFDRYDYKKLKESLSVSLIPHGDDNIETIACFDINLLLSREDPYPLVVLEAASFATPTICFAGSGGAPEFIENHCGCCVPYLDILKMAEKINWLVEDKNNRNNLGINARQKLKVRHALDHTIAHFIKIIND